MRSIILCIILFTSLIIVIKILKEKIKDYGRNSFLLDFKKKRRSQTKLKDSYSNFYMIDPNRDIITSTEDTEIILLEKADIHRSRLKKYGKSSIDGEMIYLDRNGDIYKELSTGEKKYL